MANLGDVRIESGLGCFHEPRDVGFRCRLPALEEVINKITHELVL